MVHVSYIACEMCYLLYSSGCKSRLRASNLAAILARRAAILSSLSLELMLGMELIFLSDIVTERSTTQLL